ncbi:hypothetical protein BCEP27_20707 [Burkholderia cepacia]
MPPNLIRDSRADRDARDEWQDGKLRPIPGGKLRHGWGRLLGSDLHLDLPALQLVLQYASLRGAEVNELLLQEWDSSVQIYQTNVNAHPFNIALFRERSTTARDFTELGRFQGFIEWVFVLVPSLYWHNRFVDFHEDERRRLLGQRHAR